MDIVVDANILFAICIAEGKTEEIFFLDDMHLFAPEYIFEEFEKYRNVILEKTKRSKEDFDKFLGIVKRRISIISNEETEKFIQKANMISPDKKDADYFALALRLDCAIWSNDKGLLGQNEIKIYTTKELIEKFLK